VSLFRRIFGRGDERAEKTEERRSITKEEGLAAYIIREHKAGRSVEDILEDPYLKNRANEEQRLRLLERPEVIRAIGENTAAMARDRVQRS